MHHFKKKKDKKNHASCFHLKKYQKKYFYMHHLLKKKSKIQNLLLEKHQIILYNISCTLGFDLYTLLTKIILKKGFRNLDIKRGLKTWFGILVNPAPKFQNVKKV